MKLPKNIKTKWLKALRSGKYRQTRGKLYNTKTKGFCCLGVLQHVTMNGQCETYPDGKGFKGIPSPAYWKSIGADVGTTSSWGSERVQDRDVDTLINMNDAKRYKFKRIADYIEENVETL